MFGFLYLFCFPLCMLTYRELFRVFPMRNKYDSILGLSVLFILICIFFHTNQKILLLALCMIPWFLMPPSRKCVKWSFICSLLFIIYLFRDFKI